MKNLAEDAVILLGCSREFIPAVEIFSASFVGTMDGYGGFLGDELLMES